MSEVGPLTPEELAALDPGIRSTVAWLRSHGFDTVDSGDGVSKFADAPPEPPWPLGPVQAGCAVAGCLAPATRAEVCDPDVGRVLTCGEHADEGAVALPEGPPFQLEHAGHDLYSPPAVVDPRSAGCALPVPNVAIQVEPDQLVAEADRLAALLLSEHGVKVDPQGENLVADQAVISASYDPANRTALILLTGFVAPEVA